MLSDSRLLLALHSSDLTLPRTAGAATVKETDCGFRQKALMSDIRFAARKLEGTVSPSLEFPPPARPPFVAPRSRRPHQHLRVWLESSCTS